MYRVAFHIGMPRTASTFLQKEIFEKSEEIHEIIKPNNITDIHFMKKKLNLISEEMMSFNDTEFKNIETFKKLFPNAKIIYGIRDYDDFILSWYWKYIQRGGHLPLDIFKRNLDCDKNHFKKYAQRIKKFNKHFIYDFKEFKDNPYDIIKELCDFLDICIPHSINFWKKPNKKPNKRIIEMLRYHNKLFRTNNNPNGFLPAFISPLLVIRYFKNYIEKKNLPQKPLYCP